MLLFGAMLPDIIEPSKSSYNHSKIMNFLEQLFPNIIKKSKSGSKHRSFFHSWKLLKIISIITIISFGLCFLLFNIFSWIFYLGLGYIFHLIPDSLSNIYITNKLNIPKKKRYYKNGLPLK